MSENENMDYIIEKTMNDILTIVYNSLKEIPFLPNFCFKTLKANSLT